MVDLQTEALIGIAVIELRWSVLASTRLPSWVSRGSRELPSDRRVEELGDASSKRVRLLKREKKTSREAVGASADDDAMTSIGCGGVPKAPAQEAACRYEME